MKFVFIVNGMIWNVHYKQNNVELEADILQYIKRHLKDMTRLDQVLLKWKTKRYQTVGTVPNLIEKS
jgi:hypothetical protein